MPRTIVVAAVASLLLAAVPLGSATTPSEDPEVEALRRYALEGKGPAPGYPTIDVEAGNRTVVHVDAGEPALHAINVEEVRAFDRYALVLVPQDPARVKAAVDASTRPLDELLSDLEPPTYSRCVDGVCPSQAAAQACATAERKVPYTEICPRLGSDSRCVDAGCRVVVATGIEVASGHDARSEVGEVYLGPVPMFEGRYYIYHVPDRLPDDRPPGEWLEDEVQSLYSDLLCPWDAEGATTCAELARRTYARCRPSEGHAVVACLDVRACAPSAVGDDVCADTGGLPSPAKAGSASCDDDYGESHAYVTSPYRNWDRSNVEWYEAWTGDRHDIEANESDTLQEERNRRPAPDTAQADGWPPVLWHWFKDCDGWSSTSLELGGVEATIKGPTNVWDSNDWEFSVLGGVRQPFYVHDVPHWVEFKDPYIHVPEPEEGGFNPYYEVRDVADLSDWSRTYEEKSWDRVAEEIAWRAGCAAAGMASGQWAPVVAQVCSAVKWFVQDEDDPRGVTDVSGPEGRYEEGDKSYLCSQSDGCWKWEMTAGPEDGFEDARTFGFTATLDGRTSGTRQGCEHVRAWVGFDKIVVHSLRDRYGDERPYPNYWENVGGRTWAPHPYWWAERTFYPDAIPVDVPVAWGQDMDCGYAH